MTINKIFSWRLPLLCASIVGIGTACTESFERINTNSHEATEEMMKRDNLIEGGYFTQLQRSVVLFNDGLNDDGTYQITQGLSSDLYSGYLAPTGAWKPRGLHNGQYYFIDNWISTTFNVAFTDAIPTWKLIVKSANASGLNHVAALATIVKVEAMHRVADTYGPIPYVNMLLGSEKSKYDALEDVYKKFFQELDNSIDVLTDYAIGNPSARIMERFDYVYGGDARKWVKFANTLRLRLAMRVVYADAELARAEAEKSIANPIGVMTDSKDIAALQHSAELVYHHPLHEIAYNFNGGEIRMGATMDSYMNGYKDPRLSAYFKPAVSGGYHGVRLGIPTSSWASYKGDNISNLNVDASTTQIVWMNASEAYFLRAEGALRGWNMGGTAKELYEKGIRTSFEENRTNGADAYIADDKSTPVDFNDNAPGSSYNVSAPSTITIAWDGSADFEKNLERIITQKWISMYPNGPEGWAEFRRTGYPKLFPVVANNSNGTINTTTQIRRLPYPPKEYLLNKEGVLAGVSKLSGQDNGGTKLWWDKK